MSRWSLVLRCVLLLAAWQGPMPWFHCHGTLASTQEWSSGLPEHLQSHHATVNPLANVCFGWHLHIDYPAPSNDNPNQPLKHEQDRLLRTNSTDCLTSVIARCAATELWEAFPANGEPEPRGLAAVANADFHRTAHFFDASAPSLPLSTRFCVSRC